MKKENISWLESKKIGKNKIAVVCADEAFFIQARVRLVAVQSQGPQDQYLPQIHPGSAVAQVHMGRNDVFQNSKNRIP